MVSRPLIFQCKCVSWCGEGLQAYPMILSVYIVEIIRQIRQLIFKRGSETPEKTFEHWKSSENMMGNMGWSSSTSWSSSSTSTWSTWSTSSWSSTLPEVL